MDETYFYVELHKYFVYTIHWFVLRFFIRTLVKLAVFHRFTAKSLELCIRIIRRENVDEKYMVYRLLKIYRYLPVFMQFPIIRNFLHLKNETANQINFRLIFDVFFNLKFLRRVKRRFHFLSATFSQNFHQDFKLCSIVTAYFNFTGRKTIPEKKIRAVLRLSPK